MLTKNISFKNFKLKKNKKKIKNDLKLFLEEDHEVIKSLNLNYKYSYDKKIIAKLKKYSHIKVIGMGGSILGTEAIYAFLKHKIKKKFSFINNLQSNLKLAENRNKCVNLIVSKSGNTLETISNVNIIIKKKDKNIFITENKNSYLFLLAQKMKAEIIHHNNFIGGRFSVLSEVGMLPAELMGLNEKKFKKKKKLVKNKKFINTLIKNVRNTLK